MYVCIYVSQLHGCAAVVWTGSQVDANTQSFIPYQTKSSQPIMTKTGTIVNVVRFYESAEIYGVCPFRLAPT